MQFEIFFRLAYTAWKATTKKELSSFFDFSTHAPIETRMEYGKAIAKMITRSAYLKECNNPF